MNTNTSLQTVNNSLQSNVSVKAARATKSKQLSKPSLVGTTLLAGTAVLFSSMTREQLRATAKSLNVKTGKDATDTASNLVKAIQDGKVAFKLVASIGPTPATGTYINPVLTKKLRSYKADKLVQAPFEIAYGTGL